MNNQTWLVAKNTYRTRVKGAGFWAMILSPFLVALIYLAVGLIVSSGLSTTPKLAVVENPSLTQMLKADKSLNTDLSEVSDVKTASKSLADGKIDGYLLEEDGKYTLVSKSEGSMKFDQTTYTQALSRIKTATTAQELNISSNDLQALLSPASLTMKTQSTNGKESGGGDAKFGANMGVASVTSILIFVLLMLYVGIIAQEIGNEKSSRIMETLLATTSSNVQYYGKIIGIMLLVLTQIGLYVLGFGIAYPFVKDLDIVKQIQSLLTGIDLGFGIYVLLMSVFGIVGYLFLSSIIASLVNEQAQVQQATQPIAFISMIGYIAGIAGAAVPENLILKILSFIPFISPTLMSSRYAIQYSSATEAYISLALQLIATIAVAKVGEKIYARNVLSYSSDKIFKQLMDNFRGKQTPRIPSKTINGHSEENSAAKKRKALIFRLAIVVVIIVVVILYNLLFRK